jgi:hypothetical protein
MKKLSNYVEFLKKRINNGIGSLFENMLPESIVEQILTEEGVSYRNRLYTPFVTLWIWLHQVLEKDKSCKNAVSHIVSSLAAHTPPSTNTGAYCRARERIKEILVLRLLHYTGKLLHQQDQILWHGRRVTVVDGSTVTAADTQENQAQYPQPGSQADGCGFPMINIAAVFCLFTGALLEVTIGSLCVHEINLFRSMYQYLRAGDIVLGDQLYGTYADICLAKERMIDGVFRIHWRRKTDFRKGKIVGCYDHIVQWSKPSFCSQGLSPDLYRRLPDEVTVREVRYKVEVKGFRPNEITLATTLLDSEEYPKEELAQLYELRWEAEIDLRHLKTTMRMEHLPNRTPHMVRNELYMHLLAYNLVRTLMLQTGVTYQVTPVMLSFQATIQHLLNFSGELAHESEPETRQRIHRELLYSISKERLPIRPGRVEPRLKKRRPKSYGWLKKPRNQLQAEMGVA